MGYAEGHARGGRRVDEPLGLIEADRQRLFHQYVLAGPDGGHGHREVQVVRQADADRADPRVGDQLAGAGVAAHGLAFERRHQFGHGIGHGDQPRRSGLPHRCRVDLADLAQADQPDGSGVGGGLSKRLVAAIGSRHNVLPGGPQ